MSKPKPQPLRTAVALAGTLPQRAEAWPHATDGAYARSAASPNRAPVVALPDVTLTAAALPNSPQPASAPGAPAMARGTLLAHYRIDAKLGAGGMGEVYRATDLALERTVALKLLPSHLTSDAQYRDLLIREARAQAQINHPNIGHIYFIGEQGRQLFFAMEYIDGETFAQRCAQQPVPVEAALELIRAAACGLAAAAEHGFIHRDIKPSNLMIDRQGVVKVLDFGLVTATPGHALQQYDAAGAPPGSPDSHADALGRIVGTPLYMAPEQARGEAIDARADIYALGCTLFQLLTGTPPFTAATLEELQTKHETSARPALPRTLGPARLTSPIAALVAKMIAPQAAQRFASYEALIAEIDRLSRHRTMPAGALPRFGAAFVDVMISVALIALPAAVLTRSMTFSANAVLFLAVGAQRILLPRYWGASLGQKVFELEVIDVRTHTTPTRAVLAHRVAWQLGLICVGSILLAVRPWLPPTIASVVRASGDTMQLAGLIGAPLALLYASLRVGQRRALWDLRSHTMVRLRKT